MIQLFSGTPGSGKSLHAVHEIEKNLKYGQNVISIMNVDTDLCFYNFFCRFIFNQFGRRPKKFKRDKRQNNFHYIDNRNLSPEYLYSFAALLPLERTRKRIHRYIKRFDVLYPQHGNGRQSYINIRVINYGCLYNENCSDVYPT